MASHSQTIRNGIGIVGGGPASRWNAHNWGSFRWGEGTVDMGQMVVKGVSASFSPLSTVGKSVVHHVSTGSLSLSNAHGTIVFKYLAGTITASGDMSSQQLFDMSGYRYSFPDRTTEGESRAFISWTQGAAASSAWSMTTATSTTWSES
jgi:hypothetical protein